MDEITTTLFQSRLELDEGLEVIELLTVPAEFEGNPYVAPAGLIPS